MGQLSILHWLLLLAITVLFIYPYVRVIKRAGFSGWWILTMFVPIMNLIMIWVFAFAKWPAVDRA
ncbi:hypothetical protein P0D69_26945 [Paraburkholderia sediminicola]